MISRSINSKPSLPHKQQQEQLKQWFQECRTTTLALFAGMDDSTFRRQAHPDFSPVGWHLGHIAYTEALWLLERSGGFAPLFPEYRRLLAADGLPKSDRVNLPTLPEICHYLETVREQVFNYLEVAPLEKQERLWRFILQHESQHSEIITFILQLHRQGEQGTGNREHKIPISANNKNYIFASDTPSSGEITDFGSMVEIPAGEFEQGNDSIDALDNERPAHRVYLDSYWIDRYPVTCKEYHQFIAAGGYQNRQWWSNEGWKWLQANPVTKPLYWNDNSKSDIYPVCGVSWYEADAYARFVGKRLPTEAEWEKAASWDAVNNCRRTYPWGEIEPNLKRSNYHCPNQGSKGTEDNFSHYLTPINAYPDGQSAYGCYDMLGNVWEWTASWFDRYDGFESYPYIGYSQVYFDGEHRVLKGGSWATRPAALRSSFRNWYHPGVRQIFAGFRCAKSN